MKTKVFLLMLCFCLLAIVNSFSQTPDFNWVRESKNPNANFYEIRDKAQIQFSNSEEDEEEGGDYSSFRRWNMFWSNRVSKPNSLKIGNNIDYIKAMINYSSNPICSNSSTNNSNWSLIGPVKDITTGSQHMGRVISIAVDPADATEQIIYAGTDGSGLWKSTNAGNTWYNITDIVHFGNLAINDIAIDPTSTNIIYISTGISYGYGFGVLKSTNSGATWSTTGLTYQPDNKRSITKLKIDPNHTDHIYALDENTLKKSIDGGASWTTLFTLNSTLGNDNCPYCRIFRDIELKPDRHPENPIIIYISSDDNSMTYGGAVIYKLVDDGISVPVITNITPTNGKKIIAGMNAGGMLYTTNNGTSWLHSSYVPTVTYSLTVLGGEIFAGTDNGMYKSTNAGLGWIPIGTTNIPASTHVKSLTVFGSNIFAGTAGLGIYLSTNDGTNWSAVNNGLSDLNVNSLTVNGSNIFAGTNSGIFSTAFPLQPPYNVFNWTAINTGLTNQNISSIVTSGLNLFAGTMGGGIFFSSDNGANWTAVNTGLTNQNIHSLVVNGAVIFAGTENGIFLSTDNGVNWNSVSSGLPANTQINTIIVNGTNIFAGTQGYGVFLSSNNGTNWTTINTGLSNLFVNALTCFGLSNRTAIAVTPIESNSLYALYNTPNKLVIDKSIDNGITWSTFWSGSNSIASGYWKLEMVISQTNPNNIYLGGITMYKKTNSSPNLVSLSGSQHADDRALITTGTGSSGDILYVGHDGGISKSINGNSLISINGTGLSNSQYWGFGSSEKIPDLIIGGLQDNGIYTYNNGSWSIKPSPDGADCLIDINMPNNVYGQMWCCPPVYLQHSFNNGFSWQSEYQPAGLPALDVRPMVQNPTNSQLYIGYHDVFTSTTNLSSTDPTHTVINWTCASCKLSKFTTDISVDAKEALSAIEVFPSNPNIIYAAFAEPAWNFSPSKKIFKTTDGGGTWLDITSTSLQSSIWAGVTSIVCDPENSNRVWVSFNGIWPNSENRVNFSDDGGATWKDFSIGLPVFPVNKLVYQKGTTDLLYAATDVGVFYYDNLAAQWKCFNNNFPMSIVTDIEINYCVGKLRVSTFGRGIWESPLKSCEITTAGNVWNSSRNLSTDLIIKAGSTLTISGSSTIITVSKDKKIIVEPGGTLNINGAKITSNTTCGNYMWQGIEVWGNKNLSQNTMPCPMGTVNIINGAVIENAISAVRAAKTNSDGSTDWNTTGGIIYANGVTFRNCKDGISLQFYRNFLPSNFNTTINNKSYIKNCIFETTASLADPSQKPNTFIGLWKVDGITIVSNTFRNTNTATTLASDKGTGILCNETSSFIGEETTTSPGNIFSGLNYAVNVNAGFMKSVTIRNSKFDNNFRAIKLSYSNNAIITENRIKITSTYNTTPSYGIYIENCTGYKVEGNSISSANNTQIGCVISGSNTNNDLIYKNSFFNLTIGLQVQQGSLTSNYSTMSLNLATPVLASNLSGVKFQCNKFNTIGSADVAATSSHFGNPQGLCGSITSTANNIFSTSVGLFHQDMWLNQGVPAIDYYYYPGAGYTASFNNNVIPHQCSATSGTFNYGTGCPSTLGGSHASSGSLIARISSLNSQITPLIVKIDGGNTQNLLNKVNSNMSPGNLKDALLNSGKYLSDTVLLATIKKSNPIPPGILKDIIEPNSPVTSKVMTALNNINLPAGIKHDIVSHQVGTSRRFTLEQQIGALQQTKDFATAELLRYYMNDSITKLDSVIIFLKTQTSLFAKQQLVQAYLLKTDCLNATTALNALSQQTSEDIAFKQFYSIMTTLCTQGKTIYNLTSQQKQQLYTLANSNTSVSTAAKSIINMVDGVVYPDIIEPLIAPDNQTIKGNLYNNLSCNGNPVPNDTIVLLDSAKQIINLPTIVTTGLNGFFKFNFNDIIFLDQNAKYTFGTKHGAVIQDSIFKTISQWITASPVNLNLRKLKADFVNDTVKCFSETVHFTNKTINGKQPYTNKWTFGDGSQVSSLNVVEGHKYNTFGTFQVKLKITDATGCKDSLTKQIIISDCPSIFGSINESPDCGNIPLIGDTLYLADEYGNNYNNIFAITDNNGQFTYSSALINSLDTNYQYTFKLKSGYGIAHILYKPVSYWKNSSPLSFVTDHKQYWSRDFNMSDSAHCTSSTIDINRNIYVAGSAYYPNYKTDFMLIKYDPLGNEAWHISYNPTGFGTYELFDMKTDNSGNIVLTGKGDEGTLTVKVSPSGTIIWSNSWIDDNYWGDYGYIAIDSLNNIYLASNVSGDNNYTALTKYNSNGQKIWSNVNTDSPLNILAIRTDNSGNSFMLCTDVITGSSTILKYNSSGILLWFANNTNYLSDIVLDNENSIYATGRNNNTPFSFITAKYDLSGSLVWEQPYSYTAITGNNIAAKITIDFLGNIVVAGISPASSPLILHNNFSLVKYSPDGTELWNSVFSTNSDYGSLYSIASMITDRACSIYLAGTEFISELYHGVPARSYYQFITVKFNSDGSPEWYESINTTKANPGGFKDLIVSDNENLYVTGSTVLNGVRTVKYVQCPSNANTARYTHTTNNSNSTNNSEAQGNNLTISGNEHNERLANSKQEFVTMFPNPNDGNFYFNYSLPEDETCKFILIEPTGKKIYNIEIRSGRNTVMVNSNDLSNGVYYYQVLCGNRLVKTDKLVITK